MKAANAYISSVFVAAFAPSLGNAAGDATHRVLLLSPILSPSYCLLGFRNRHGARLGPAISTFITS